jgi:hypothetical protein
MVNQKMTQLEGQRPHGIIVLNVVNPYIPVLLIVSEKFMNKRLLIPGVGIYKNKGNVPNADYPCLMPTYYAVDTCLGDAYYVDHNGSVDPDFHCPLPVLAEAFGRKVGNYDE